MRFRAQNERIFLGRALFALSLLVLPVTMTMAAAAQDAPPAATAHAYTFLGSWKLNVAKSNFGDGSILLAMTVKVTSATSDLIEYTATATYGTGSQGTYSFKGPVDGKEHPLTGSASLYSYSDDNGVLVETQKDPDGTLTKGTWALAPNGKEGTWTYTITNPDASIVHQKLVFTRVQ
jgi:hypothetical protein